MIAGDHYDEETLIEFAEDRPEKDTYPHLSECTECRSAVDEYRTMITCMSEAATWDSHPIDETPNPQTIATLRSFVDRMHQEDAEADPLVAELLAGSREEWMPRLMADPKYRTAGVVRKLIAAADQAIHAMPPDAVEITRIACEVADVLDEKRYTRETVLKVRADAYRELGFALFYVGNFDAALDAQRRSETTARICASGTTEVGRALLLRALVLRQTDAVDEALAITGEAEETFRTGHDREREAAAISTRAYLLSKAGDFRAAIVLTRRVLDELGDYVSAHDAAILAMNLGVYSRELGDFPSALLAFQTAAFAFEDQGMVTEACRMEWNIAVLLKANGDLGNAETKLRQVISDFERLGMLGTAAVATVDLAETKLLQQEPIEVASLCRAAMRQFETSGIGYSTRALAALALLREAADGSRVPLQLVRSVRRYLDDLRSQPTLEFAYLAEPLSDQSHNLG
jgi:tetratricopeptide (TPR) repeat protein